MSFWIRIRFWIFKEVTEVNSKKGVSDLNTAMLERDKSNFSNFSGEQKNTLTSNPLQLGWASTCLGV